MKTRLALLLCLLMTFVGLAAGEEASVLIDENGQAVWTAVDGAVSYEYLFVDAEYTSGGTMTTTGTTAQVPLGHAIHIHPLLENGEYANWITSDFFGEPVVDSAADADPEPEPVSEDVPMVDARIFVDETHTTQWSQLQTFDLFPCIDHATAVQQADGSLYFEAAAPGGTMRFVGYGVTLLEDGMTFAPGAKLYGLDALGRICAIGLETADPGTEGNNTWFSGGYTFSSATSVDSPEDLFTLWGLSTFVADHQSAAMPSSLSLLQFQPNFIVFGADASNADAFTLSALTVYYDEATFSTGIRSVQLNADMYGTYLEGDRYDTSLECFDLESGVYSFFLVVQPDILEETEPFTLTSDNLNDIAFAGCITGISDTLFTIGDLKDAAGQVLDKTSRLSMGSSIQVTLGDYTADVPLPVIEQYTGAQTLHDLTPYNNAASLGDVTALVVPVYWQDQPQNATDELLARLKAQLGRVEDAAGQVTDYSDQLTDSFSLSSYYDIASYGQYRITSFVTDWYAAPYDYTGDKETVYQAGDTEFPAQVYDWLLETYPDMDWSRFDKDADGFLDSVILINTGTNDSDVMYMGTYAYAQFISPGYTGENAGTPDKPALKNYVGMNISFLGTNTLIHEYGHGFGLIDYYDVSYTGIDALGGYDMQSSNMGDWNAYSKYAVGWINPQVITNLSSGETVEVTLRSFADTGDALVLPAAGAVHDGPFDEYLLLDLFTTDGVNRYDAPLFDLDGALGVRITHVNAKMEKRVLTGEDGVDYPIGTVHIANAYNPKGQYLLEIIQAGGVNTLTALENLRPRLTADDLFTQGDTFTMDGYAAFFHEGLMDDGSTFGYKVEIVTLEQSENGAAATLRITRE